MTGYVLMPAHSFIHSLLHFINVWRIEGSDPSIAGGARGPWYPMVKRKQSLSGCGTYIAYFTSFDFHSKSKREMLPLDGEVMGSPRDINITKPHK